MRFSRPVQFVQEYNGMLVVVERHVAAYHIGAVISGKRNKKNKKNTVWKEDGNKKFVPIAYTCIVHAKLSGIVEILSQFVQDVLDVDQSVDSVIVYYKTIDMFSGPTSYSLDVVVASVKKKLDNIKYTDSVMFHSPFGPIKIDLNDPNCINAACAVDVLSV